MFGFKKHCLICGIDVTKETAIKRFGKYFCNEEHAQQMLQKEPKKNRKWQKKEEGIPAVVAGAVSTPLMNIKVIVQKT